MGVDYYLACGKCCEFIDLHKWPIVNEAKCFLVDAHLEPGKYPGQRRPEDCPYRFADLETRCKKVLLTAEAIERALDGETLDHQYILDLTPIVRKFAVRHRGHRLFLSCDITDGHPWELYEPQFADWLEVGGVFQFCQYLPRHLIDVEGLQSWQEVLDRHRKDWPFIYEEWYPEDVEVVRVAFEERLAAKRRV